MLSGRLGNRVQHEDLVGRGIIRDQVEDNSLKLRQSKLGSLLENRSSKARLLDLNIIKNESNVSDRLMAVGSQLNKQKNKETLDKLFANRPTFTSLVSRGIVVDENSQKQKEKESAKALLGDFFGKRPKPQDLVDHHILNKEELMDSSPAVSHLTPHSVASVGNSAHTVYCAWGHTCVLNKNGQLYSFGSAENGRLGTGELGDVSHPVLVELLHKIGHVEDVSLGDNHCAAIVKGSLYVWGKGSWGRLGLGNQNDVDIPTFVDFKEPIVSVACGGYHSLALTKSGHVYSFGWGKNGRLGVGADISSAVSTIYPDPELKVFEQGSVLRPVPITFLNDKSICNIYAGEGFSVALSSTGKIYSWGNGIWGCLGHGDEKDRFEPVEISYFSERNISIKSVSCGGSHVIAYSGSSLYSWGRNQHGQLGRAANKLDCNPSEIIGFKDIVCVNAGKSHSAFVNSNGELFTFGHNSEGMLGHGDKVDYAGPKLVETVQNVASVSCGWSHTACVLKDGSLFTFGSGVNGRLGV